MRVLALVTIAVGSLGTWRSPAQTKAGDVGATSYADHCAMCHGADRSGHPPTFPSLVGVTSRLTDAELTTQIHNGKGSMPGFPKIQGEELAGLLTFLKASAGGGMTAVAAPTAALPATGAVHEPTLAEKGGPIYQQNCAFCHGRDAAGGESGPDLTRSLVVRADMGGDKIGEVLRNGRLPKMPAFRFADAEVASIAAFVHGQATAATAKGGKRRGVDVSDLQTGNVAAGKAYFEVAGGCAKCHSATGDLAGIASRYEGLQLEMRMLYPRNVKSKVTVTAAGTTYVGTLVYQDEFLLGMKDADGTYRSWSTGEIKFAVDSPVNAHVEQFPKYTDADIHNLMAYIQTLK